MSTITTKELTTLKIPRRYHHTVKSRLAIVHYATDYGIKGAARRFGLDRKTVRAWRRRLQAAGLVGLVPRYSPIRARRIAESTVALIEHARRDLMYGAVRTRIWLERVHRIRVAAATIRRICHRLGYPSLRRKPSRRPRQLTLFSRERPGDCVLVDRGGSGNSDSVISGSLASAKPPRGGDTKERGNEEDETEPRSDL